MRFEEQIKNIREYQLSLINDTGEKIEIDESRIDLFYQIHTALIPEFTPSVTLKPWSNITRVSLDIETTGIEPDDHQVKAIGLGIIDNDDLNKIKHRFFIYGKDTQGLSKNYKNIQFYDNEYECIEAALRFLVTLRSDPFTILEFHNGFLFDLPFLEERSRYWGIDLWNKVFWKSPYLTVDSTAQMFGRPISDQKLPKGSVGYHSYYSYGFELVDTMHKALSWDFVNRKLTGGVGLKNIVYELNIEDQPRQELEYHEMLNCYKNNDWHLLLKYLKDDLTATLKLGDYLVPPYYYQLQLLPHWRLQSIFTRGNGSKWNDILLREYSGLNDRSPGIMNQKETKIFLKEYEIYLQSTGVKPDIRRSYVGAKTGGTAGLYRNVGKIDVASLYPSIMLNYGICSSKDTKYKFLSTLKYCWEERIRQKSLKHLSDEADMLQASLKVLINSGYGSLGTNGIIFNDYKMAALVTAYGRAILDLMDQAIVNFGGTSIELDTDGIYFTFDGDHNELLEYVQSKMPRGIVLENEMFAKGCYIPPYQFKPNTYNLDIVPEAYPGMKKNYILVGLKLPKNKTKDLKVSGIFRNRSVPEIFKSFIPDTIKQIIDEGYNLENDEFLSVTLKIIEKRYLEMCYLFESKKIDKDFIMVTRKAKISKNLNSPRRPDGKVYDNGCVSTDDNGIDIARYFYRSVPRKKGVGYTKKIEPVSLQNFHEYYDDIKHCYLAKIKEASDTISIFTTGIKVTEEIL